MLCHKPVMRGLLIVGALNCGRSRKGFSGYRPLKLERPFPRVAGKSTWLIGDHNE